MDGKNGTTGETSESLTDGLLLSSHRRNMNTGYPGSKANPTMGPTRVF